MHFYHLHAIIISRSKPRSRQRKESGNKYARENILIVVVACKNYTSSNKPKGNGEWYVSFSNWQSGVEEQYAAGKTEPAHHI
jgi:hypothetical protein